MDKNDFEIIEIVELEEIKNIERQEKMEEEREKRIKNKNEEKQELLKSEIILNELDDISEPILYDDHIKTIQITFEFRIFDFSFKLILPPDEYKNLYKISKLLSNIFDSFKCEIIEL